MKSASKSVTSNLSKVRDRMRFLLAGLYMSSAVKMQVEDAEKELTEIIKMMGDRHGSSEEEDN